MKKEKKTKQTPKTKAEQAPTVVVKEKKQKNWIRNAAWVIVIALGGSFILPIMSSFAKVGSALADGIETIIGLLNGEEKIQPDKEGTNEGQSKESRVINANTLLVGLDPEEDMPANFDEQLLSTWENGKSYGKVLFHYDEKGNLQADALIKVFKDPALETPMYLYAANISHKHVGWKFDLSKVRWWEYAGIAVFGGLATVLTGGWAVVFGISAGLSVGFAGISMQVYDTVASDYYLSYDGKKYTKVDPVSINMTDLYYDISEDSVGQLKINAGSTIASFLYSRWSDFTKLAKEKDGMHYNGEIVSYIGDAAVLKEKRGSTFVTSTLKPGFTFGIYRVAKVVYASKNPVSYENFYTWFPLETVQTKYAVASDNMTLYIPQDEQGVEDFTSQDEWGWKKYIDYSFNGETMQSQYKTFALDEYAEGVSSLALRSKLKSKYYAGTNIAIEKSKFNSNQTNVFLTKATAQGVQIITLPYALKTLINTGLTYQFEIRQQNANGDYVGDTVITTSNSLTQIAFDNETYQIPFELGRFEKHPETAKFVVKILSSSTEVDFAAMYSEALA